MAKAAEQRLTAGFINSIAKPGSYGDGGRGSNGLRLVVTAAGTKHFRQRLYYNGKRHNLGLGPCALVSLAQAREKALANRRITLADGDPLAEKRKPAVPTFAEAAEAVIELRAPTFKPGSNSEANWRNSLARYAFPKIGGLRVDAIGPAHVAGVLEPIWTDKRTTAERVKERVREVLQWSPGRGFRTDNPVDAAAATLPKARVVKVKHHAALPYSEVAGAIARSTPPAQPTASSWPSSFWF